jgi:hypothetical protein
MAIIDKNTVAKEMATHLIALLTMFDLLETSFMAMNSFIFKDSSS